MIESFYIVLIMLILMVTLMITITDLITAHPPCGPSSFMVPIEMEFSCNSSAFASNYWLHFPGVLASFALLISSSTKAVSSLHYPFLLTEP